MKINGWFVTLVGLAYVFAGVGGYYYGKGVGEKLGLDKYHEACYTGGIVVNETTGTVVQCSPLGRVPKEEFKNFFPQGVDKS